MKNRNPVFFLKDIELSVSKILDYTKDVSFKEFEKDFIDFLNAKHKDTLNALKAGKYTDELTAVLDKAAKEIAAVLPSRRVRVLAVSSAVAATAVRLRTVKSSGTPGGRRCRMRISAATSF